jgi:hypothetical protein
MLPAENASNVTSKEHFRWMHVMSEDYCNRSIVDIYDSVFTDRIRTRQLQYITNQLKQSKSDLRA